MRSGKCGKRMVKNSERWKELEIVDRVSSEEKRQERKDEEKTANVTLDDKYIKRRTTCM